MLVLTRKPQEKIRIGENITITVIKTKGQGVRLGIEAPKDISVLRGELVAANEAFSEGPAAEADAPAEPSKEEKTEVRFGRTNRSRVGTVLPDLLGEPGPLRAMLASRGVSAGI